MVFCLCIGVATIMLSTIIINRLAHLFQQPKGKLRTFHHVSRRNRRSMFGVKPIVAARLQGTLLGRKALHKQNSNSVVCALRISSHENKNLMRHRVTGGAQIWRANACDYAPIVVFHARNRRRCSFQCILYRSLNPIVVCRLRTCEEHNSCVLAIHLACEDPPDEEWEYSHFTENPGSVLESGGAINLAEEALQVFC